MELNSFKVTTEPRPAATVILLRESAGELEVFMLKRHGLSDVLAGAYVFPGGKIDAADGELDMERFVDRSEAQLQERLHEPIPDGLGAASLHVGALRELFEECGVLLAEGATADHALRASELLREGYGFNEALGLLALKLQTSALLPWSRWITPKVSSVSHKRFDTRFFVSALPASQGALHDNRETTASVWMTPRRALESYWAGAMEFAPPQLMSLAQLSHFRTVSEALGHAARTHPPLIAPEPFEECGLRTVAYPGDPRHPQAQRVIPGPTRLVFRNRRFEPPDGFESLFSLQAP